MFNDINLFLSLLKLLYKKIKSKWKARKVAVSNDILKLNEDPKLNEKFVARFIAIEKGKRKFENSIANEYKEKVLLFGFVLVIKIKIIVKKLNGILIDFFSKLKF